MFAELDAATVAAMPETGKLVAIAARVWRRNRAASRLNHEGRDRFSLILWSAAFIEASHTQQFLDRSFWRLGLARSIARVAA
jgi:hypothetical protein